MRSTLILNMIEARNISAKDRAEILDLCSRAYGQDYQPFLDTFHDAVHVLGCNEGKLVSHGLWVTRWLQYPGLSPWRTAYVEAVATDERYRNRGFATQLMKKIAGKIGDYDIGGLCTGSSFNLYSRLGWKLWQGPLFIRTADGTMSTPEEKGVMVLMLPKTPDIDLDMPLSAEWREGELW